MAPAPTAPEITALIEKLIRALEMREGWISGILVPPRMIEIDLQGLLDLGSQPPAVIMWTLFVNGGWIPVVFVVGNALWTLWLVDRQTRFAATVNPVLLAIDVPKATEQSPKAVESLFATLLGARSTYTKKERWWIGRFDPIFAFEIVSIEGQVQFLVRSWEKYRDALEAAIYAQYPDAEISEVADYTDAVPRTWPNDTYELFGTEFGLSKPDFLPIRTYVEFEHGLSAEFKDPMASFLEGMSKVLPGEQIWFQILVQTNDTTEWLRKGGLFVKKMIGAKTEEKQSGIMKLLHLPFALMDEFWNMLISAEPAVPKREEKSPRSEMLFLSPGERVVVENVERKLAKIAYRCKIRWLYIAPKGRLRTGNIIAFLRGAIQQFTTLNMNKFGLAPNVTTKRDYFWQLNSLYYYLSLTMYQTVNERMQAVFSSYRARSVYRGEKRPTLNIEELATLWHFPVVTVKAPVVKKAEFKRAEPPSGLPVGGSAYRPIGGSGAPPNLPTG